MHFDDGMVDGLELPQDSDQTATPSGSSASRPLTCSPLLPLLRRRVGRPRAADQVEAGNGRAASCCRPVELQPLALPRGLHGLSEGSSVQFCADFWRVVGR